MSGSGGQYVSVDNHSHWRGKSEFYRTASTITQSSFESKISGGNTRERNNKRNQEHKAVLYRTKSALVLVAWTLSGTLKYGRVLRKTRFGI